MKQMAVSDNEGLAPLSSSKSEGLAGTVSVPGDKSISHRALLLASQAVGVSNIKGLLEGEDVLCTAAALRLLGVSVNRKREGDWQVSGVGVGGFSEPDDVLDMGNSGTGVRLMMGLVASYPFTTFFTGDKSLRSRPMRRVVVPLQQMGGQFISREGGRLPLAVTGGALLPLSYTLPVASAQVKTSILLAGLNTPGNTTVIEPEATRDHTELMLSYLGAELEISPADAGGKSITLKGRPFLRARDMTVPGDPSSAAFLIVAALITPHSHLVIENVCINPLRIGLYQTLIEMGANIKFVNIRQVAGEDVADIEVQSSQLKGIEVPAERAPSMIDEYPILSVAAVCAEGKTVMRGLAELKVKESDRLQAIASGLEACGVICDVGEDSLTVSGDVDAINGGATVATYMDHRIAMAFLVLGFVSQNPVTVDDGEAIKTSFPGFVSLMKILGAKIHEAEG